MKYLALLLSALALVRADTTEPNSGPQPQGFLFGFSQTSLILPITYTCPTPLYLSAATSLSYNGPDAQGPYSIVFMVHEQYINDDDNQVDRWYSHTEKVADMNNARFLTNPWMNGTQFMSVTRYTARQRVSLTSTVLVYGLRTASAEDVK